MLKKIICAIMGHSWGKEHISAFVDRKVYVRYCCRCDERDLRIQGLGLNHLRKKTLTDEIK